MSVHSALYAKNVVSVAATITTVTTEGADFTDIPFFPPNPAVGLGHLYKKPSDTGLYWRGDFGAEIDLTQSSYTLTTVVSMQSPYTILTSDSRILADTKSGPVVLNLPSISTIGGSNHKTYIISDVSNNASVSNITINHAGANTLNGDVGPMILTVSGSSASLYSNGIGNWVVS